VGHLKLKLQQPDTYKYKYKCRPRTRIIPVNFVRIAQGTRPLGEISTFLCALILLETSTLYKLFTYLLTFSHFGLPGYSPGTIAVKVTRMERGFNAGQTHRSMYPFIFNRLRAIARYWSEIATFCYPLAFNAPVGGVPIGIPGKSFVLIEQESWGYQAVKTVR